MALYNAGSEWLTIKVGDRIAQMIFHVVLTPELVISADLDDTSRGIAGFGSTDRSTK